MGLATPQGPPYPNSEPGLAASLPHCVWAHCDLAYPNEGSGTGAWPFQARVSGKCDSSALVVWGREPPSMESGSGTDFMEKPRGAATGTT